MGEGCSRYKIALESTSVAALQWVVAASLAVAVLWLWNLPNTSSFQWWQQLWDSGGSSCSRNLKVSKAVSWLFKLQKLLGVQILYSGFKSNLLNHTLVYFFHFSNDSISHLTPSNNSFLLKVAHVKSVLGKWNLLTS